MTTVSLYEAGPKVVWERPPRPHSVGLALSGGAARGLAHVGVLEVLDEHRIPIHYIAGTSAGALAGGLYAAGISGRRMRELVRSVKWTTISTLKLPSIKLGSLSRSALTLPLGLLDLDRMIDWIDGLLGGPVPFEQLNIPFAAIAADVAKGETVVLNEGPIAPAIRISCTVPGVFTPARRNGRLLVDGGAINNLPVTVVRQMGADYVIAVDLLPPAGEDMVEPSNILEIIMTSLYSLIRSTQKESPLADRTIAPAIARISLADLGAGEALMAAGRAAAEAVVPLIKGDLGLA